MLFTNKKLNCFAKDPDATWCCRRAIDADVCVFNGKLHMYFATRDHELRVQKAGGAWAELDSDFGKNAWTMLANQTLLAPEMKWEGECIEAPATILFTTENCICFTAVLITVLRSRLDVQYQKMESSLNA